MEKTLGFVIKCKDYSESSQIVWLYTRDFGKIKFITKGSRGKNKKFKGKIDLFTLIEINFRKNPKRELHTLTECDVIEPFSELRNDLGRFATASYMVELLEASSGLEAPAPEIYYLVMDVFNQISKETDLVFWRCVFVIKLTKYSGHFPKMDKLPELSGGTKAIISNIIDSISISNLKVSISQVKELIKIERLIIDYSVHKRLKSLDFLEEINYGAKK